MRRLIDLLFRNSGVRQTVVKNTFWLFSGEVFGRLIRAAIVIYAFRLLGAAEYGVFSYAMAIAGFVTIFSDLGISAILTRESVKNPAVRQEYFSTALAIKSVFILINTGIILFLVPYITRIEGALPLLPLVAAMLIFETIREFGFAVFRAFEQMEREAFIKILTNVSITALGFFFLWISATAKSLTTGYLLGSVTGFLATVILLFPYFRNFLGHIRPKLAKQILALAWPIGLLGVLGSIIINTDMIMLAWWQDAEQVGFYAAGQKPVQLFYVVPALLASAVFPTFVRLANANNERFRLVLEKSITASLVLGLPVLTTATLLAPQLLTFVYGVESAPAVPTFQILLTTLAIVFPSTILSNALFAYNKQRTFIFFVAIGALSNALFNYLLIPSYGIEGAAIATIGSQLLANYFVWRAMKRTNYFTIARHLPRILISSAAAAGVAAALQSFGLHVLFTTLISAVAYLGLLWLMNESVLRELYAVVRKSA